MGEPCGTHSLTLEKAYKGVFIKKKKKRIAVECYSAIKKEAFTDAH